MAQSIRDTLIDEPPFSVREGGFIRKGFNAEVDRLHEILSGGKGLLADIETREKEKTGIRTLKIGYNKVFGYYIEVSNSFKEQVPETYIRKQTLVNGERYITEELKNLEQEILTAGDRDKALEFEFSPPCANPSPPRACASSARRGSSPSSTRSARSRPSQ